MKANTAPTAITLTPRWFLNINESLSCPSCGESMIINVSKGKKVARQCANNNCRYREDTQ